VTAMLAGEQAPQNDTEAMKDLLQSLRETLRDRAAQRTLGLFVLAQISGHIKSGLHAEKAMQRARSTPQDNDDE